MTGAPPSDTADSLDDQHFLHDLRKKMLAFATLQLSDGHLAEDAVQEAMLGALRGKARFEGRAALKTWVFAILKNKIADMIRQKSRQPAMEGFNHDDEDGAKLVFFNKRGHWLDDERPHAWSDPEASYEQQQFWRVFEACLERLPPKQAQIFMMREFLNLETDEICAALGVSQSNVFVILHRARLGLRRCLEINWYQEAR